LQDSKFNPDGDNFFWLEYHYIIDLDNQTVTERLSGVSRPFSEWTREEMEKLASNA
jgi:hypothetical protein